MKELHHHRFTRLARKISRLIFNTPRIPTQQNGLIGRNGCVMPNCPVCVADRDVDGVVFGQTQVQDRIILAQVALIATGCSGEARLKSD